MLPNISWGGITLPLWRTIVKQRCLHNFLGKKQLVQPGEAGWIFPKGYWPLSRVFMAGEEVRVEGSGELGLQGLCRAQAV